MAPRQVCAFTQKRHERGAANNGDDSTLPFVDVRRVAEGFNPKYAAAYRETRLRLERQGELRPRHRLPVVHVLLARAEGRRRGKKRHECYYSTSLPTHVVSRFEAISESRWSAVCHVSHAANARTASGLAKVLPLHRRSSP